MAQILSLHKLNERNKTVDKYRVMDVFVNTKHAGPNVDEIIFLKDTLNSGQDLTKTYENFVQSTDLTQDLTV